ncbi:hypothetical protein [Paenibacillus senegalensis]|uniref:hypothetical protein n=1 Tax=Paenibacillus senegalensis TaxID=1465766 RepID=UPI0003186EC0|nr:hypothetical protein [Paenibacillus senegalensis]
MNQNSYREENKRCAIVYPPNLQAAVQEHLHSRGYPSFVIGEIRPGSGKVEW